MTYCRCGCRKRVRTGVTWRPGHNMRVAAGALRAGKRTWTVAEEAKLRRLYPHMSTARVAQQLHRTVCAVNGRAGLLGLHKTAAYLASPEACRLRPVTTDNVGARFRFAKGHVPANKGLRRPGWSTGRMRETQFKKGTLNGVAATRWMPIGSTRLADGYVYRKVADVRAVPWTRNWKLEHVLVWGRAHGKVPKGHALAFKNGDRTDIRLDNLECITRHALMARNTVHNLPAPLPRTIQLLGALNRQIRRRTKDAEEQDGRPQKSPVRNARSAQGRRQADGPRAR